MQLPSAESDWLIFLASSRVSPEAPVLPTFSLPAKSAKFNLPVLVVPSRDFWLSDRMNKLLTSKIFEVKPRARSFTCEIASWLHSFACYWLLWTSRRAWSDPALLVRKLRTTRILDEIYYSNQSATYHFAKFIDPNTFARGFSDFQVVTFRIQQIPNNFFVNFQERTLDRVLCARGVVADVLEDVWACPRNNTYITYMLDDAQYFENIILDYVPFMASSDISGPNIVKLLPAPVWPYAKIVPL